LTEHVGRRDRRRILVITHVGLSESVPGGHRWSAMRAYLEGLGYEVMVLASSAFGKGTTRPGVVEARDLTGSPVLRRLLRRPPLLSSGEGAAPTRAPNRPLAKVAVPDVQVAAWALPAAAKLRGLLRARRFDCIVTSGPPHSASLLPLTLGRARPPWVVELRDGWRFESITPQPPVQPLRALDAWLERRVVRSADRVIAVTEAIAEDLETRLGVAVTVVSHGWDPMLEDEVARAAVPETSPDSFTLVHTGLLGGPAGRDADALFEGLRRAAESGSNGPPVELVLAGRPFGDVFQKIASDAPSQPVRHVGYLDRPAAIALQRRADALILHAGSGRAMTSKLVEYLTSGRPIIVLGVRSEAARIVARTRTGTSVPADDPAAIARVIRSAADGHLARSYAPRDLERFRYPGPAEMLAEEIERAIASRRR
jgi:hypothetical protein